MLCHIRDGALAGIVDYNESMYDPSINAALLEGKGGGAALLKRLPEAVLCLPYACFALYKMPIEGMNLTTFLPLDRSSACEGDGHANPDEQERQYHYGPGGEKSMM